MPAESICQVATKGGKLDQVGEGVEACCVKRVRYHNKERDEYVGVVTEDVERNGTQIHKQLIIVRCHSAHDVDELAGIKPESVMMGLKQHHDDAEEEEEHRSVYSVRTKGAFSRL
jgi:hypothetical protein